jgi:hypothetical protein
VAQHETCNHHWDKVGSNDYDSLDDVIRRDTILCPYTGIGQVEESSAPGAMLVGARHVV